MVTIIQQPGGPSPRRNRNPQHRWQVRHRPWQIQPICIAPVLPGETLRAATLQSRCVTDPIRSPLVGWWLEYYWFYVKHRDLTAASEDLVAMALDPTSAALSATHRQATAADTKLYQALNDVKWTEYCLDAVVAHFFRDGDDATPHEHEGLPIAQLTTNDWLDSIAVASDITAQEPSITVGVDDVIKASEVETLMRTWELLHAQGLTNQTYADFLRSYGVRAPAAEQLHRPELLRYIREWQYPSNTVEPTTGAPSSAVSWAVSERLDKARFFPEPGFIFGVTIARPKVFRHQTGSAAGLLDRNLFWLPAVLQGDLQHSWVTVGAGDGPLPQNAVDWSVDLKDLYIYGDQFVNFSPDPAVTTDAALVDSPEGSGNYHYQARYMALADSKRLFKDETNDVLTKVRQDGVVSLTIAGRQSDTSPRYQGLSAT